MRRGWLLATLILGACEQPASPVPSRPWTMFDFQQAFIEKSQVLEGVEGFPGGFPYNAFVKSERPQIPISSAFTEGGFSPYITTNVWANFPEVWIQPMYILVTDWDPETHEWKRLPGAGWIYTVGPQSRFHSPFWRVYWARVPEGTPPDQYTSSAQILRDKLPLVEGPGWLVSLVPNGTALGDAPSVPFPIPDLQLPRIRTNDYLDGEHVTGIDFGINRFDWNDELEVIEQPFFVLVTCKSRTECAPSGAPNIGGTGPLFERRPPILPNGRPRFGSFWRLYFVMLPANDDVGLFIPASVDDKQRSEVANSLYALPAPMPGYLPAPVDVPQFNKRFMQVALNARECFATPEAWKDCKWLDSQKAIEELLPQAIKRTGITVTCPFIAYDGKDVKE